jgi:hypothetical protein
MGESGTAELCEAAFNRPVLDEEHVERGVAASSGPVLGRRRGRVRAAPGSLALGCGSGPKGLLKRQHASALLREISQQAEEVPLDQCRGAGQARSVAMAVDRAVMGPLVAHELGAVLWRNDAYRVGGEAVP